MGTSRRAGAKTLRRAVRLTPAQRLYALGGLLLVALAICSCNFGDRGGPYFMASLTVAGVAYLLAVRELLAGPQFPRHVVVIGLVLAAAWQVAFLRLPAGPDDDIHRYVWDGHLQGLGYNPYLVVPNDPAAKALHTPETRNLNNPDLPSPYPPGAQFFFRAVAAIHESTFALKVAFVLCGWAIAFLVLDVLHSERRGAHLVLAYAWNPLLVIEVAGSGHIDIVGALLVVISVAALLRRWRAIASVALGLAVAVKFLPIVLVPLYWKRVRIRDVALAVGVVGLLYVPFLDRGHVPTGSLGTYVQSFRFNGPVFAMLYRVAPPQLLVGLAVGVGLAVAIWIRRKSAGLSSEVFAWPMAASLLFAPVVFPWYLLWLVPFVTSSSLLIVVWTVSIIPTYIMWHFRTLGRAWGTLPVWVMAVEYGCVVVAAVVIGVRRRSDYSTQPKES